MENQLDQGVVNLAKAIRQTESGGNFQIPGKSGEYGGYQFTEPTWKDYSSKYGINTPLKEATPEQQNAVVYNKIKEWKDSGKDVTQIASMWNAGEGEPDAYTGKFKDGRVSSSKLPGGKKNSYGVEYDVPGYVKNVATEYMNLKNSSTNPSNTEKKLTFADIQQKDAETTPVSDPNAPGNVISNLSEGNYGGALQSGIRGFANLVTLGGSEDLAQGISSPVAYGAEKIKGFFGGKDYSKYVTPQTEKEKDQAYSGGAKSAAVIGTLATLGAGSGMLAASRAKILTTPAVLDNIAVPAQTFLNASKITQLNYLKNALKTAQASRSGQTIGQIEEIAKAIKYLTPSSSWITKLLKSGFKEATRFALYNILGNKVGGIVSGVLQD